MAKSRFFAYDKQERILNQFQRDLRNEARRTQLTATEQCIVQSLKDREKFKPKETVRFSHYNPNNPLNGSLTWNKAEQEQYKLTGKNPRI